MNIEESIDERNSMQMPYRMYTSEEQLHVISDAEIEDATKFRNKLQAFHLLREQVDVWST